MFSSLKSFSSNINSNYSVSQTVTSTAGAWKIYDAKKKSTGKPYSVFVFDKKALDTHGKDRTGCIVYLCICRLVADSTFLGSSLGRSGASAFKRSTEEVRPSCAFTPRSIIILEEGADHELGCRTTKERSVILSPTATPERSRVS